MIRTKERTLVAFEPNKVQVKYLDILAAENPEFRWRDGFYTLRGVREDVLKARQQGMSTLWLALYFLDTINTPMTQTLILAHDAPTTEKLFKIVHRFYEHLPAHLKRPKKYSTKREIEFSDIDSIISVGTAGSAAVGRGGTVNNVHMSERAFWPDGNDVETGLMESVPLDGNATRETTANGLNEYADERTELLSGGQFTPRFFAWSENPEYALPIFGDFECTEEEKKLARLFKLSDEQLNWRRSKRLSKKQREKFPQEYPLTEAEAFLTSGNSYFDNEKLTEHLAQLDDPALAPIVFEVPDQYRNLRREKDGLELWEAPRAGRVYVIGADTAEGITRKGADHDYDSASVWDAETEAEVARLHGRWDTHLFGLMLAELGFWYNTALLGIERNNHGHAVINAALYTGNYPEALSDNSTGMYMHQEYDERKKPTVRRPGLPTTGASKYLMLDELASAVEGGEFHARSAALVGEMLRFVKLLGGKAGAETGHDDRVIDAAIARRMMNLRPRHTNRVSKKARSGGFATAR